MSRSLRIDGESDAAFQQRVERAGAIGWLLVDACLANECMQRYIADPALPLITPDAIRQNPVVRIEYEEAIAFGGVGETLNATKSKHWGDGPSVLPLEPGDWFFPDRITYCYRSNSRYNRRFEQRCRLKELLGRRHRRLVRQAQWQTKKLFLELLTEPEAKAIRQRLEM